MPSQSWKSWEGGLYAICIALHTAKLSSHVHHTGKPDMNRQPMRAASLLLAVLAVFATSLHAQPQPEQQPARWRGDFVYFADSAIFTDCATGQQWPVAKEGDYLALEKAYLNWQGEPKAPVLANFDGHIDIREPMEGPLREHMIVDRFISVQPGTTCESLEVPGTRPSKR